jgi:Zn-dependent protease with chaperone function
MVGRAIAVGVLLAGWGLAQEPAATPAPREATAPAAESTATAPAPSSERIAVPEASPKAMRYYRSGIVLWWLGTALSLAVPALLLFSGFAARLRDLARRLGRKWFFALAVFVALYIVIDWILGLPLSYYSGFVRQHAYGLSNQTFGKWIGDSLKGLGVGIVGSVLFVWIPYLLVEKSPRRWWLYTALALIPFLIVGMFVAPIWIDPLFNDFGPMQDKDLEAAILATAERAGIEGGRVYEVDKSVDTNAVNAYVTGFGGTQRIVLWDTIIAKLDRDELLFVMGHEMGHYAMRHVVWSIAFSSVFVLVALYLIYRTAGWCVTRWGDRFGFRELHDFASLPLALLLLGLYGFLLTPGALAFSRYLEHEADRFALELTRDNHAGATAFVKLQTENLSNPRPGPIYKLWRASHPPLGERIDFCNDYRPWERGQALRYEDLFSR